LNSREKSEYLLNLTLYLIQVFSRAEDDINLNKHLKNFFEILNTMSIENQIFHSNNTLQMLKMVVKASVNSPSSGKFEFLFYQYLNKIEKFYSDFFELNQDILNNKTQEVNFIFGDFYYCASHLMRNINLDDSVLLMILANRIYYYKLGSLSQNFKETNLYIKSKIDKTSLNNLDGESKWMIMN